MIHTYLTKYVLFVKTCLRNAAMFCTLVPVSDRFVVISGMHGMALQHITCAKSEKNTHMLRLRVFYKDLFKTFV